MPDNPQKAAARLRIALTESWRLVEASRRLVDETQEICERSLRRYRETQEQIALTQNARRRPRER